MRKRDNKCGSSQEGESQGEVVEQSQIICLEEIILEPLGIRQIKMSFPQILLQILFLFWNLLWLMSTLLS